VTKTKSVIKTDEKNGKKLIKNKNQVPAKNWQ